MAFWDLRGPLSPSVSKAGLQLQIPVSNPIQITKGNPNPQSTNPNHQRATKIMVEPRKQHFQRKFTRNHQSKPPSSTKNHQLLAARRFKASGRLHQGHSFLAHGHVGGIGGLPSHRFGPRTLRPPVTSDSFGRPQLDGDEGKKTKRWKGKQSLAMQKQAVSLIWFCKSWRDLASLASSGHSRYLSKRVAHLA